MKLDDVKNVNEMAKPAKICPKCGHAMAGFHTYRGKNPDGSAIWTCKGSVTPKAGFGSQSTAPSPSAAAPSAPSPSTPKASPKAKAPEVAASPPADEPSMEQAIKSWLVNHGVESEIKYEHGVIDVEDDVRFTVGVGDKHKFPAPIQFGKIGGDFCVTSMDLKSLRGCPKEVGVSEFGGNFTCDSNPIESFEGGPEVVHRYYTAIGCTQLTSIKGIARHIGSSLTLIDCEKLKSLEGIQDMIDHIGKELDVTSTPIESHVVGVMLIDGLKSIRMDNKDVEKIINKHLSQGRNPYDCQEELIDAGFEAFAQL